MSTPHNSANPGDFANVVLKKENARYLVTTSVTILPREGYIAEWRINKCKEAASERHLIPAFTTIGLLPSDELLASEGIVVKEGEYKVQIKKLINALTGEVIE